MILCVSQASGWIEGRGKRWKDVGRGKNLGGASGWHCKLGAGELSGRRVAIWFA